MIPFRFIPRFGKPSCREFESMQDGHDYAFRGVARDVIHRGLNGQFVHVWYFAGGEWYYFYTEYARTRDYYLNVYAKA